VTEKLGLKWAAIAVLLLAAGWLLVPRVDESGERRSPIKLGIDISGGTSLTYDVSKREIDRLPEEERGQALVNAIDTISKRIDTLGLKEINVRQLGETQIQIDLARGTKAETDAIKARMLQLGNLEFLIELTEAQSINVAYNQEGDAIDTYQFDPAAADAQRKDAWQKGKDLRGEAYHDGLRYTLLRETEGAWRELPVVWMPQRPKPADAAAAENLRKAQAGEEGVDHDLIRGYWLYRDPRFFGPDRDGFTGKAISDIRRDVDDMGGRAVTFRVLPEKQRDFGIYTGGYVGKPMAICLNDEVWSAPRIEQRLEESVQIHNAGGFSAEEQNFLVNCLQSGSLRLKPRISREETIGPSLGANAVRRGVTASVVAFAITILFMLWYYRFGGLVANIALLLNVALTLSVVSLFDATLTLPGIAGLILTIGMAVDANILVFERTREEAAKGKGLLAALQAGYDRAFITILDANLTTAITAALLVRFGSGPIKGFGVTLLAGIAVSMFTALFVTKVVFGTAIRKGVLKELRFRDTIKPVRYPFVAKSRPWIAASVVMAVVCIVLFAVTGRSKYGLDFTGGTAATVRFKDAVTKDELRAKLASLRTPDGKEKFAGVEIADRTPDEAIGAAAEYDVKLQSTTEVDTAEVKHFVEERAAHIFPATASGGPRLARVGNVEAVDRTDGEWTVELEFADEAPVAAVKSAIDQFRDAYGNTPFAGSLVTEAGARMQENPDDPEKSVLVAKLYKLEVSRNDVSRGNAVQDITEAFRDRLHTVEPFGAVNYIGPNVVVTLKESAIVSMTLSIIAIILYCWFRFKEAKFGVAASVALLHDVLIPLGIAIGLDRLGILDVPITLQSIAAYLTIIGFSINDTIVIFDRVRENMGSVKGSFREIVDLSLGQTLSRTILTSLTVLMVVTVLFMFNVGQDSPLEGFAFTMLLGVLSGTYSTIFIACPLLVWLHEREAKKRLERRAEAAAAAAA